MAQFFAAVMRNAWVTFAVMMAAGAGLVLIGATLPAVLLFLLSGLLLMYLSNRKPATDVPPDADTA